jgi:hypothetical protein
MGQAQEAMAQLRSRGVRASFQGDWLVLDVLLTEDAEIDRAAAELLDRVWPAWRECVAE